MDILVVSEKPSAARKIADALSGGKARTCGKGKVKYFEFIRDGNNMRVAASVGHVYGLRQKQSEKTYPAFDIEWVASHEYDKNAAYTKDYLSVLKMLAKEADEVVNACDYDTEGSLIGYNIIRFNAPKKKHSRMKFSTLTAPELRKAFEERGSLDVSQAEAGEARHELDWLWGINASRALMAAIKKAGIFRIMSIGRVQGPALAVLAEREKQILSFKPEPYWQLFALVTAAQFEHVHGKFFDEAEATGAFSRSSKQGVVKSVEASKVKQRPPPPFDLTTLQMEAYRCFGFSPTQTLQFAQNLYEDGLISYPRTSSQKLSEKLGLDKIIGQLALQPAYQKHAQQLVQQKRFLPAEGKKDDPAHPAIHPTGEIPRKVGVVQAKLYDLITKRFLACFAPEAKRIKMNVVLTLGKEDYSVQGARTHEAGWHDFYAPYTNIEETVLPPFEEGKVVEAEKLEKVQKETQPPKRFTPASVIRALEAKNLGTKATRASIVQTLFDRQYLTGKSIEVTPLGLQVEQSLERHVPEILSEQLTRQFEEEMEAIEAKKLSKNKVVEEGRSELTKILEHFKQKEPDIGKELVQALNATQRDANVLGVCKACGKSLLIRKSKFGYFVGCSGYPACRTIYPLPREAKIKPMGKVCEKCGTPIISVQRKAKRTFQMCLDPKCETKASWGQKKEPDSGPESPTPAAQANSGASTPAKSSQTFAAKPAQASAALFKSSQAQAAKASPAPNLIPANSGTSSQTQPAQANAAAADKNKASPVAANPASTSAAPHSPTKPSASAAAAAKPMQATTSSINKPSQPAQPNAAGSKVPLVQMPSAKTASATPSATSNPPLLPKQNKTSFLAQAPAATEGKPKAQAKKTKKSSTPSQYKLSGDF